MSVVRIEALTALCFGTAFMICAIVIIRGRERWVRLECNRYAAGSAIERFVIGLTIGGARMPDAEGIFRRNPLISGYAVGAASLAMIVMSLVAITTRTVPGAPPSMKLRNATTIGLTQQSAASLCEHYRGSVIAPVKSDKPVITGNPEL
jgi:hypothetical protein